MSSQAERAKLQDPIHEDYVSLASRTNLPPQQEGDTPTHTIVDCARCGGRHEELDTYAFYRPILDHEDGLAWRWWITCPTTGDPILMASRDDTPL